MITYKLNDNLVFMFKDVYETDAKYYIKEIVNENEIIRYEGVTVMHPSSNIYVIDIADVIQSLFNYDSQQLSLYNNSSEFYPINNYVRQFRLSVIDSGDFEFVEDFFVENAYDVLNDNRKITYTDICLNNYNTSENELSPSMSEYVNKTDLTKDVYINFINNKNTDSEIISGIKYNALITVYDTFGNEIDSYNVESQNNVTTKYVTFKYNSGDYYGTSNATAFIKMEIYSSDKLIFNTLLKNINCQISDYCGYYINSKGVIQQVPLNNATKVSISVNRDTFNTNKYAHPIYRFSDKKNYYISNKQINKVTYNYTYNCKTYALTHTDIFDIITSPYFFIYDNINKQYINCIINTTEIDRKKIKVDGVFNYTFDAIMYDNYNTRK